MGHRRKKSNFQPQSLTVIRDESIQASVHRDVGGRVPARMRAAAPADGGAPTRRWVLAGGEASASSSHGDAPMGSEQVQEAPGTVQTRNTHAPSRTHTHPAANTRAHSWMNTPPNACCFCWCCCCSCSCLTVRAAQDEKIQRLVYERPEVTSNCEEIPEPSLEEARCWAQSFERLIKSPAGRGRFRQFLRTEFSEENLLFWLACEELKKETNRTVVEERVRQIYEDFISILSPREVSLDSRVRDVINRNMQEPSSNTFDDAQQQIYTLMQRDSYPRFMNSSAYADLIKSLEDPPSET